MSCLSGFLSCCLPTRSSIKSAPETQQSSTASPNSTSENPTSNNDINTLEPAPDGYSNVIPLPVYTPRPMSIQEKTLEAHMRDPPISSDTYNCAQSQSQTNTDTDTSYPPLSTDEKQRLAWEESINNNNTSTAGVAPNYYYPYYTHPRPEEATSDVSSAYSVPSSYGNTSTATRETPPPPYSPPIMSPAPSRRSMSISSAYRHTPMAVIAQPPPVFQRPEVGFRGHFTPPRRSIDEQISAPAVPSRPVRFSWESDRR